MGYLRSFRGHLDSPDSNMISTIYSAPQKTYTRILHAEEWIFL